MNERAVTVNIVFVLVVMFVLLGMALYVTRNCTRWEPTGAIECQTAGGLMRCAPEMTCVEWATVNDDLREEE